MILKELLDTKFTNFKVIHDNEDEYDVEAKIGKRRIQFTAARFKMLGTSDFVWTVDFSEKGGGDDGEYDRHTFALTGSGKEFAVFAFIKQCLEQLIEKHTPRMIKFTADKVGAENRATVYEKMLKRFLKGYSIRIMDDGSRQVKFTLEKI
jgi:hypothetical protein